MQLLRAFRSCHEQYGGALVMTNARQRLISQGSPYVGCRRSASLAGTAAAVATAGGNANSRQPQEQSQSVMSRSSKRVRLAVVGDIHGQWGPADAAALRALEADAVLWVGDIGNEDVGLVQQIAELAVGQKAVILGNHDAWYSMTSRGRQRAKQTTSPPRSSSSPDPSSNGGTPAGRHAPQQQQPQQQDAAPIADRVQQQLDVLGDCHVGFGHKALPGTNISIVGARPFSKGGKSFSDIAEFMSRFGVTDMQQSADKVLEVINSQVPHDAVLVIMAHNGPAGLGGQPHSICGVDWLPAAGDHGDPDLQAVLQQLHEAGRDVALVLHGHMHHMIKGGGRRQMVHVDTASGTVVLNAATVPRVVPLPHSNGPAAASRHHFLVVELQGGVPCCAADVWVQTAEHAAADANPSNSSQGSSSGSILDPAVLSQQRNFLAAAASAMHGVQHSKAKSKTTKHAAAKANQEEAVRRVQLQAPQQLQLWREQHAVDGYQVHIAEVYEVLRSIDTDSSTADTAGDAARSGSSSCRVLCWQYFDAHAGKWVVAAVASTQRQPAVQH